MGLPALAAEAARLRARVSAARGDVAGGAAALQDGLDGLAGTDLLLLRARLHLDLGRLHEVAGARAEAVLEAREAAALLSRLDVITDTDDVMMLRRLGVELAPRPAGVGCRAATLQQYGQWWTAGCGDTRVRLRTTKGLRYLAELVAHPGVERHALDLVDRIEGVSDVGIDRRRLGDAGEQLDARSRALYRRRVAELRDKVEGP